MAADNVVTKKLGELWDWVSSTVTAPKEEPVPPGSAELARVADQITQIDARIQRLHEEIEEENVRIHAEGAPYRHAGSRMPKATLIKVKAMLHNRGQLERTLHQAYEMRTRLQAHLHGLENAMAQRAFVTTLRETQGTVHGHLTDYDVRVAEDVMEEQRDLEYRAAEWHGTISARGLNTMDDADVEEELAGMLASPPVHALPDAVHDPPTVSAAPPVRTTQTRGLDGLADLM